ncbi:hypothetical protein DRP05_00775 [Archaeoglobales archaeon]|nr:MAG: hypothetical protein DRP05_00775 [Archaeoglobales archaeon]
MKYEELKELLKRIEFNKTEPEILAKLVESAQIKGEKAQRELRNLRGLTGKIVDVLWSKDFFFINNKINETEVEKYAVGIDGSFQLVGGIGGKWYLFLSVTRILFKNGLESEPEVEVFWADIDEIDEQDTPSIRLAAEEKMLTAESKAILNWGSKDIKSVVFIDGPIIDPPFSFRNDEDYINYRCEAFRVCLKNSIVIGCVKRVRDRFFVNHIINKFNVKEAECFPTDQHLMLLLFTKLRQNISLGSLYTNWIDLSELNTKPYKEYKENDVYVVSFFYERDIRSKVLRIDVPFTFPPSENVDLVNSTISKVINILDYWTYPGQDPLPVLLAHEKCNIRKGAAEVLYEEILTKSRSVDPFDQLVASRMR